MVRILILTMFILMTPCSGFAAEWWEELPVWECYKELCNEKPKGDFIFRNRKEGYQFYVPKGVGFSIYGMFDEQEQDPKVIESFKKRPLGDVPTPIARFDYGGKNHFFVTPFTDQSERFDVKFRAEEIAREKSLARKKIGDVEYFISNSLIQKMPNQKFEEADIVYGLDKVLFQINFGIAKKANDKAKKKMREDIYKIADSFRGIQREDVRKDLRSKIKPQRKNKFGIEIRDSNQ